MAESEEILRYLFFFCSIMVSSDFYKSTNYTNVLVQLKYFWLCQAALSEFQKDIHGLGCVRDPLI
jgi:hypothetical protein